MVGFHRKDTLTPNEKVIAGTIAGCLTRCVTQPFDVVKLRYQLAKTRTESLLNITRDILRNEGITTFWAGHNIGQLHSITALTLQFYVYEITTAYANNNFVVSHAVRPYVSLLCGTLAGCAGVVAAHPLDVIRLRQIVVQHQYRGLLGGMRNVYKSGGLLAFYHGLSASLLQTGPNVGISFAVFSTTQPMILRHLPKIKEDDSFQQHSVQHVLMASAIAGSLAGFVAKTVTYPFDLAKRRLQMATHAHKQVPGKKPKKFLKCKQLINCLLLAYKFEGARGLFRGWTVTIYKSQVTSVVAFTTYECVCYIMRATGDST